MINLSDLLKQPNTSNSNLVLKLPEFEIDEMCICLLSMGHISRTVPVRQGNNFFLSFYIYIYHIGQSHNLQVQSRLRTFCPPQELIPKFSVLPVSERLRPQLTQVKNYL